MHVRRENACESRKKNALAAPSFSSCCCDLDDAALNFGSPELV